MTGHRSFRSITALALAALALFAAPPASNAEEGKPSPPRPQDGLLVRLRLQEGTAFAVDVRETLKSFSVEKARKEEQVGQTDVHSEGELTVLSAAGEGGGVLRFRWNRVSGSDWNKRSHAMTSKFDSGDPDWDYQNCDKWVRHHMREVGRQADLTVTPGGTVSKVVRPADGSRPFCMFSFVKDAEEASRILCDDLRRFFPGLPEAAVGPGSTWTVKVRSWGTPGGRDLGPFGWKFAVLGKPGEFLTATTTATAAEAAKGDLEAGASGKGTVRFDSATGMMTTGSLSASALRIVANTSDGPIWSRYAYEFGADIRSLPPK